MFNKFKEGDKVQLLDELTRNYYVEKVWMIETTYGLKKEMVALDDNKVYRAEELTFYSEPILILARKIRDLENKQEKPKR